MTIRGLHGDMRFPRQGEMPSPWVLLLGGIAVAGFFISTTAVTLYTDWLWFQSVGYSDVFLTIWTTRLGLFTASALFAVVVLLVNLLIARRLAPKSDLPFIPPEEMIDTGKWLRSAIWVGSAVVAVVMGLVASGRWELVLRGLNASSFDLVDPIFNLDSGFYVFALPVWRFVQSWLIGLLVLCVIGVGAIYGISLSLQRSTFSSLSQGVRAHLSVLACLFLLLMAANYTLETWDLVHSPRGAVFGGGYTDVTAQLFALRVLTGLALLTAVLFLASVFLRSFTLPVGGLGVLLAAAILLGNLYPSFVQRFEVVPNELEKERPYIAQNIRFTRYGFGLDRIGDRPFGGDAALTRAAIDRNPDTIQNIRIWDPNPLRETYNQIQSIRLYYDFLDVDVDRYVIDGKYRQVMLSVRELSPEKLASQAQTWVNQRLVFTHGYGVTFSPVNEVSQEGLPRLLIQDVPPTGFMEINRPEVYYGEKPDKYVVVKAITEEFDYPKGEANVNTTYQEESGVRLSSPLRRLAFAWRFGDMNLLISSQLTPESSVLFYRQIRQRVAQIAPFLTLDRDPYIAVVDGRLVWLLDAYTTTDKLPYAERYQKRFNYIRNSVKVTVDAYTGAVSFYVAEPTDPLIQTYARIFPTLFRSLDEMSPAIRAHLRYPEDLFLAQAEMYRTYHVNDPQTFYNREDIYSLPLEIRGDQEQEVRPYYVIMRLPGEQREEFLLMLPFTPAGEKNNTVAWLAARADDPNYGRLISFTLPKDRLVFGPRQVESRIDQHPIISAQFALWNQSGARVIRGNMLMIPVEDSFLFIEPIFLQAQASKLPELKRIIVASGNQIGMEPTLNEALESMIAARGPAVERPAGTTLPGAPPAGPTAPAPTVPVATPTPLPLLPPGTGTLEELARSAQRHFQNGQEALQRGDWTAYGQSQEALRQTLQRMAELASVR